MNADLTRRMRSCPTCGGSGRERKRFLLSGGRWTDAGECPECEGGFIPAETPEEYAARLQEMVEQARQERDWLANYISGPIDCDACPIEDCNFSDGSDGITCFSTWLEYAARAVAGKDRTNG